MASDEASTGNETIEPTETWMNITKSGKGFSIRMKNDFKTGDLLLGSTAALQDLLDGKRTGINLGIMTDGE